jgi:hypothetical protein
LVDNLEAVVTLNERDDRLETGQTQEMQIGNDKRIHEERRGYLGMAEVTK